MAKKKNDCPLFKHRNGQWAKKVKGKLHYFGTDRDEALKKWAENRDRILAGLPPITKSTSPTLKELGNVFIARCRKRVSDGELSVRSVSDYEKTIGRLIELLGKQCSPEHLSPMQFAEVREKLAEPIERTTAMRGGIKGRTVNRRSPGTVAGDIRRIRAFLTWCHKTELIPAPRFGEEFSPPSAKVMRRQRAKTGPRDLSAEGITATLGHCSRHFKPLVLLGINAGIGGADFSGQNRIQHLFIHS